VSPDRVGQLVRSLQQGADGGGERLIQRLCQRCVTSLGVQGVGMYVSAGAGRQSTVAATDATSAKLEELQVLFGEGPCVDALAQGVPVLVADLKTAPLAQRWPAFTPSALEAGVRAAFAFPLAIGAIRIGAMDLYRDRTGPLESADLREAGIFADAAVRVILDLQRQHVDGVFPDELAPHWSSSAAVHQATGMAMVQLGTDVVSAFAALRARAYGTDRSVQDVARDIVEGRLRLEEAQR
jgi:hypothetical protein